ncbi:hypothetical protein CQ018_07410 [Arthrobacter sp. MYb227]|uniref:hypothetical protein n=1 Tax=Arthrobacter sp. MYb227 TaxID=1848601 RepID=UPI000CFB8BAE|nr:hypothetical protein [Arthrobacter sp. MYb227]PQZ93502.1 hypothetical protein CQ018_07410 [Arthrobacter sp. MYb227]
MKGQDQACETETFLLIPHTVTALAELAAGPDQYLVSVDAEPKGAAKIWFDRAARNPFGGAGCVHIRYFEEQLIPLELWDDTVGIWDALLDAMEGFLATGVGRGNFSPEFSLVGSIHAASFSAHGVSHQVDPLELIPAVLDGAQRYFSWIENMVGRSYPEIIERIQTMTVSLNSFSPTRAVTKESHPRA